MVTFTIFWRKDQQTFLNSLTGNVRRVMVEVRVLTQNIKPSSYRAEEQVGRRGQESGKNSGLVYYLRFFLDSLVYPWLVWNVLYLEITQLVLGLRGAHCHETVCGVIEPRTSCRLGRHIPH